MTGVAHVRGVWRRSLLVRPDGTRDTTGLVVWMQGERHFVDLRQPPGRPAFNGPDNLTEPQLAWLALQEGFAGELVQDGEFVVWQRALDLQPPSGSPDSARLWFEGATLVEEGRHAPYLERWEPLATTPPRIDASGRLREGGRDAMLLRCDDRFMLMLAATDPARRLTECEISLGRVLEEGWLIEHSTLPWREDRVMRPGLVGGQRWFADGPTWEIVDADGDVAALAMRPSAADSRR